MLTSADEWQRERDIIDQQIFLVQFVEPNLTSCFGDQIFFLLQIRAHNAAMLQPLPGGRIDSFVAA